MNIVKKLSAIAAATFVSFGLANLASAECIPDVPCLDEVLTVRLGGGALTMGEAISAFQGEEGEVSVTKDSLTEIDLNLQSAGDTCGPDCADTTYSAVGRAMEQATTTGWAKSLTSEAPAAVVNQSTVQGLIEIQLLK